MTDDRPEPRFDIDLQYGKQGELLIGDYLTWVANGNGQVEVKRKRRADDVFYIELECDKGRRGVFAPSGLNVTTAAVWAFVIGSTEIALFVPVERLRRVVATRGRKSDAPSGSAPTRGVLLTLADLLQEER